VERETEMAAPRNNKNAVGNKGGKGRTSLYKPDYADQAQKLCAMAGFTDQRLAEWFEVTERTINSWKLKHVEFASALRAGKAETDDLVERSTVSHITGYYIDVEELDRLGQKHTLKKWISGNAHAGIKWLAARRPEEFREQKNVKHTLHAGDAFLRFLEQMEEANKLARAEQAKMIEHMPDLGIADTKSVVPIEDAVVI
jgi:hypothetical protein